MVKIESVIKFLTNETENIEKEIEKINAKMDKIIKDEGAAGIEKLRKLDNQKKGKLLQQCKLYELIGRHNEIKDYE